MSEVQRRSGNEPARRGRPPVGVDAERGGSTLDISFVSGAVGDWSSWTYLPVDIQLALDRAGHAADHAFVSGAIPPEPTVRDGVDVELGQAWLVDDDALTVVDAVRPGALGSPDWQLTVRRSPFVGEVRERTGTVVSDATAPGRAASMSDPSDEPDVLAVLPAPVRRQVLATVPEPDFDDEVLAQSSDRGRPVRQEARVVRATSRQLIAVRAVREIAPDTRQAQDAALALSVAPWQVQALTARLGRPEVTELDTGRGAGHGADGRPRVTGTGREQIG